MTKDDDFAAHRGLVFSIAYNILGSVSEAEDTVQNTYLQWRASPTNVSSPRAYLAKIATNQALSLLRKIRSRREDYVGPWLPEPLNTEQGAEHCVARGIHPEDAAVSSEAVSTALLVVLESLSADERTVFILREVFDFSYSEIAEAIDKSQDATRQILHRAREQVKNRRRSHAVDRLEHANLVKSFVYAVSTGDVQALVNLVDPSVTLTSDGGGKVSAARKPVHGADNVIRFLLGIMERNSADAEAELIELNGLTGIVVRNATGVFGAIQLEIVADQIRNVFITVNPDKLMRL